MTRGARLTALLTVAALSGCGGLQSAADRAGGAASAVASPSGTAERAPKGTTDAQGATVPWISTVYDPSHPTAVPGTVADPSVRWCAPADLVLGWAPSGPPRLSSWPGQAVGGWMLLTNVSRTPCGVQGIPTATAVGADGRRLVTSAAADRFTLQRWVRLDPGSAAAASVEWSQMCEPPDGPYRLAVALPDAPAPALLVGAGSSSQCEVPVHVGGGDGSLQTSAFTPYALNATNPMSATLPTPLSTVGLLLLGPSQQSARAGALFRYQLTMVNAAPHDAVPLDPCVGYRESLVDDHNTVVIVEMHLLNCAALHSLPPNSTTTFDMEIAIPADVASGTVLTLSWDDALGDRAMGGPTITVA